MKYQIKKEENGYLVNFGGSADFGPVASKKEAEALAALFVGLTDASEGVEYDIYPTPESTLNLLNKILGALK